MRKKKLLYILPVLFLLYIIWLGYHLLWFKTYKTPPPDDAHLEIEGAYHIHTVFSDGRKHPDKIAKIASDASLDFIILTDHGNPNYECLQSQGWKKEVLVLAGSELSVSRGHLVALGFKTPSIPFPQNAERASQKIEALHGFSIIAHPYSKASWSWGKIVCYQGLEIMNGDTILKRNFISSLPFLPALLVKPEFALLKMVDRPYLNLKKWDTINATHSIYGYFSVDAHLIYRPLFSLLRLHVLLRNSLSSDFQTAKNQVTEALRKGSFYNSIDAAAQARGFRFWASKREASILMGRTLLLDSPVMLHIKAQFPFSIEILLIHDGKTILRSTKTGIAFEAKNPGTYRVEIYLKERTPLGKDIPWIISNPIFLQEEKS
ncbi:MAG: hypothetical protein ACETWK_11930 [Candidatus Aminicenantaceae bacterium]